MRSYPLFYRGELLELLLSTIAVFLVFAAPYLPRLTLAGALVLFALAFLAYVPHELAHKFIAQYYGYPAKYSIVKELFLLTLVTAIPGIPLKLIAPGTVYIYAPLIDKRRNGIISAAGPATNIVLGLVALWSGGSLASSVASLSGWIALFNLVPFGPLDGKKIAEWNLAVWLALLAPALWLTFFA
ncbi:zinc metalloprotease [Thermofilum pendens]|uniref:Peptidase M50 n=1 Tax=Thermofilum pendens (strain DSM 2475 / Hrk 5) TaxID=368408 RepID=A1RYN0_THEPD|nr:peptidase M50 [Thermofilum pendens]ABL78310.1 peptidase M50 [Thermofilum pendens Hrk 5]